MTNVIFGRSMQNINHKFRVCITGDWYDIYHRWSELMSMKQSKWSSPEFSEENINTFIYNTIVNENLINETIEIQGECVDKDFAKSFKKFVKEHKLPVNVTIMEGL